MKKQFKINLNRKSGIDGALAQTTILGIVGITLFLVILPVLITIASSFKTNYEIYLGVWELPSKLRLENWSVGFANILPNMFNSIIIYIVTTFFVVFLGSLSAYVLVSQKFFGKVFFF